jgi:hypothetical protein
MGPVKAQLPAAVLSDGPPRLVIRDDVGPAVGVGCAPPDSETLGLIPASRGEQVGVVRRLGVRGE